MRTENMIASINEDVVADYKTAAEGFSWLNEILVGIKQEAQAGNSAPRIAKLAAAGAYLAVDLGNYFAVQCEEISPPA